MLRFFYFFVALIICLGLLFLGLWPWAIKPRLHELITHELQATGAEHGLLIRANEFNITGLSEIELVSAKVEDAKRRWSAQAPLVTVQISPISLFFGTQPLRKLSIVNPTIVGEIVETGQKAPQFNLPAGLAELSIQNGFVQLEHPQKNAAIRINDFNATFKKRTTYFQIALSLRQAWLEIEKQSLDIDDVRLIAQLTDLGASKEVNLRTFDLIAKGTSLSASGLVVMDKDFRLGSKSQIHFAAKSELGRLAAQHQISIPLEGTALFNGELRVSDKGKLLASGRLGAKDLYVDDISVSLLDAGFNFQDDILAISELEALFGGTLVRADAQVEPLKNWQIGLQANFERMSLYDMLTDIGIKSVFVDMSLGGQIDAKGNLWPKFALSGQLKGSGDSFIVADRKARAARPKDILLSVKNQVSLKSSIAVDDASFRFIGATISDGISVASTDCTLSFDKHIGIDAKVKSDDIDFRSIKNKIGDEIYEGRGRVSATLSGPYEDILIRGWAKVQKFVFEKVALGSIDAEIAYRGDDLNFRQAVVDSDCLKGKGELRLNFRKDVDLDLNVKEFSAKLPQALSGIDFLPFKTRGDVKGSLSLRGPASLNKTRQWQGALEIQSNNAFAIESLTFGAFELKAQATAEAWNIESMKGHLGDGLASASGTIRKKDFHSQLKLSLDKIPLFDDSEKEGLLDGNLALSGSLFEPKLLGRVAIDDLKTDFISFGRQEITFASAAEGHLALSGTLFSGKASLLGELSLMLEQRSIAVKNIEIKTKEGDDINMSGRIHESDSRINIAAGLNLDNLKLASENIDSIRGRLEANILLLGSLFDPNLSGKAELKNGHLTLSGISRSIDSIGAKLTLSGKEILINSMSGKCGQGFFEGHGRTLFSGYSPKELEGHMLIKSFPLPSATFLLGTASGVLDIRKLDSDINVSGDLRVTDAYIASELKLEDLRFSGGSTTVGSQPVRLDLKVRTDSPVRLDTDLIVGEMDANLHVVGTHLSPGLVGYLELKGAQANFRNNEYQLQRARIDFDDTFKIVPRLDILASSQIDNYLIEARIQGTPERPQLHLTSDPYLPETGLLTLMSLGYVAQDIKGFAATARNTGLEAISAYFGIGQNLIRFANKAGSSDFLRLEDLSLSSIFSKTDGVSLPALRLGMNVGSGIKLRLHSTLVDNDAGKREQRVELEQSLGRQMKWRFGWDSDGLSNYGDAGVDLWYRWELD